MKRFSLYNDEFVAHLTEVRGRTTATGNAYAGDLSRFAAWVEAQGITSFQEVTTQTVEGYLGKLRTSMTTKARCRSAISALFHYLHKQAVVSSNPCNQLESIKVVTREPEYLSSEQFELLLTAARHTPKFYRGRNIALLNLLFKAGLRRSEVVGLNVGDIDLETGRIKIHRKGGKVQLLPLHSELIISLKNFSYPLERAAHEPFFTSRLGSRLSGSELYHIVKKYIREAGLSDKLTVHSARHGFAATTLSQGMPITHLQRLLGHSNLSTTERYVHLRNDQVGASLERVSF